MSITDQLVKEYQEKFDQAINHPLVKELCAGTLPGKTLCVYLLQDLRYFSLCLKVILKTSFLCDDEPSTIRFGKQIGFICNDENDYFYKTIDYLTERDPSLKKYQDKSFVLDEVKEYTEALTKLATRLDEYTYGQMVTFLWTTEVVYLRWAQIALADPNAIPADLHWRYKEWITLHSGDDFEEWVNFLQKQVDAVKGGKEEVEAVFRKTVDLEYGFFEACYKFD